ncbi:MAG: T9SS type A sorting domain-containing protein [Saprospiraceae bacterium]|nr:T9SS type A sorting domain-containing protein [Saprospiraceae bacterium]
MKKNFYTLFLSLLVYSATAQIYSAINETASRYNPADVKMMVYDDAAISNAVMGSNNALDVTQVKVGIRRLASAPATDVNIYSIDFVAGNYVRIGAFSLPANGATAVTQVLTVGDGVAILDNINLRNDTAGYLSGYFGIRFSNIDGNNGWRVTNYPAAGGNNTSSWRWGKIDTTSGSASSFVFSGTGVGCFHLEVFATTVIPVEMTSFTGKLIKGKVELDWATASEHGNDYFEVQRSYNGDDWKTIGTIKGAGTTNLAQNYHFTDAQIEEGQLYYYRLADHSEDGKVGFTKVVSIQTGDISKNIRHYVKGNPTSNQIAINCQLPTDSKVDVTIMDISGRIVQQETHTKLLAGEYLFEYDGSKWADGAYFYRITTDKGLTATGKFLKRTH